jgi:acetyltransferase-like isoleucine patch superfamily enzyme
MFWLKNKINIILWTLRKFNTRYNPLFRKVYRTEKNQSPITFSVWFMQKVLGFNREAYWPVHFTSRIVGWKNIYVGIDAAPGLSPNCYIQAVGKIFIDDYAQIAPCVSLISSNHFLFDIREHIVDNVKIGKYCSIGTNSVILPGVELGDFTYVSAGSVVKNSFKKGYCVIGGNPAKLIMEFDEHQREKFLHWTNKYDYHGYIPKHKFEKFRKRNLNV